MTQSEPWQTLLCESLVVLAMPSDDQIRANGPGCVACDLLNDFEHARTVAIGNAGDLMSEEQRNLLESIDRAIDTMESPDFECFKNEVLGRPIWQQLRDLAVKSLHAFGWKDVRVKPFAEVSPGVWKRPPVDL